MTLQTLVSAVKENTTVLASKMQLETDSIIINQCNVNSYEQYEYNGHLMKCYSFKERGVGLSRNNALLRATADIVLFSDEDIVYQKGYAEKICNAFKERPYADMLLFNIEVEEDRATYHTDSEFRVHRYNCGRYPTYSFAIRRERIMKENITFSLLFGGGAKYSNGEDSIFIKDCLHHGLRVYALPISIGKEEKRPSTWFNGYTKKFFFDRGVLYRCLYGNFAKPLALRFLLKHREMMFQDSGMDENNSKKEMITLRQAYLLMKQGMLEWK